MSHIGSGISAKWVNNNYMSSLSLGVFGLFMFTGLLSTFLIPETKRKSLEVLSNEIQTGFMMKGRFPVSRRMLLRYSLRDAGKSRLRGS